VVQSLSSPTLSQAVVYITGAPQTWLSWNTKLMSRGRDLFVLTKASSPGGRSFFVLLVSMDCRLTQTDSTLWTGDQPCLSNRSRHIMPLE
jgi:hypothetical protein